MIPIIVRYGEMFLKSEPVKRQMGRQLVRNIKSALRDADVEEIRGRVIVRDKFEHAQPRLEKVFGITSFSPAREIESKITVMEKEAAKRVKKGQKFAIRANRPYKKFRLTSQEINEKVGAFVVKEKGGKVDLKNPEVTVHLEVFKERTFLYTEKFKGPGGLPLGVSGKVVLEHDDENALAAGWLIMKRGCEIDVIGPEPVELRPWSLGHRIRCVESDDGYPAVVRGDTEPEKVEKGEKPVLYPLIGMGAKELVELRKRIGIEA